MPLLNPIGVTITPQRYTEDFGEEEWVDLPAIDNAVFDLGTPATVSVESGKQYTTAGSLFVPKGSDLKDADRVTYQGHRYGIVGDGQWNMLHPFTGADFGYVQHTLRSGG